MAISVSSKIRSKADLIAHLNPKAWDVNPPQYFPFSNAHVELMVADTVKTAASGISNKSLAKRAAELSKRMAGSATASMVASWEPGDDICPPWPWPWPGPRPHWSEGPSPQPWKEIGAAVQVEIAHTLVKLATLTTSKEYNQELRELGGALAADAAASLAGDFSRTTNAPRKAFK
jgi:hypothetical protein